MEWAIVFAMLLRERARPALFPYTTLFRSRLRAGAIALVGRPGAQRPLCPSSRGCSTTRRKSSRSRRTSATGVSGSPTRSEEHTSELQSHVNLVCRLLLEKQNYNVTQPDGV